MLEQKSLEKIVPFGMGVGRSYSKGE